jgi:Zn-finger nucleic acid-binding protein
LISKNIFTIDIDSASTIDKCNRVKGSLFLVELQKIISMHDYSSDSQLKRTIKYERRTDGTRQCLSSEIVPIDGYNNNNISI